MTGAKPTVIEGEARVAGSSEGAPQLRRVQLLAPHLKTRMLGLRGPNASILNRLL
jgi:hypothetical protein